jgi:hypothetical protein
MAYEYNPDSSRFEIANPHRVENAFLLLASALCLICAILALLHGRAVLESALTVTATVPIVVAAVLLFFGLSIGHSALRQLRFFFGRNQPVGLAQELGKDGEGSSALADALRETLRQNAISYPIPTGAVDNLLYSLSRDLVFAPPRTQNVAREEFHHVLLLGFLLVCFGISILGVRGVTLQDWVSAFYLALIYLFVWVPIRQSGPNVRPLSIAWIAMLIIIAVLTPVVLPYVVGRNALPYAHYLQLPSATFGILAAALAAAALLLMAALSQQVKPNRIAMAQSLQTLSMNAAPNQIFLEFDREMQRGWTEKIPNRVYMRWYPKTNDQAGAFEGHRLEETQPVPQDIKPLSLMRCLQLGAYRWLVCVDLFALITAGAGAAKLLHFSNLSYDYGALIVGLSLLSIARFAFLGANRLWRRFEFTSKVYWLECQGNYTKAKASVGALLQDRIKTEKDLVNVEDMTLRLWVAEVDSVCFGPDTERSLVSIRGLPTEAEQLAKTLAQFGRQQAAIVSPQADSDLHRLAVLNRISPVGNSGANLLDAAVAAMGGKPFCSQCGAKIAAGARFCSQCGAMAQEAVPE